MKETEDYHYDQTFEGHDFQKEGISEGEFENCTFLNCSFSNTDLSGRKFIECRFENCSFDRAKVSATVLRKVVFKGCKLLGVNFDECEKLLMSIELIGCQAHFASFVQLRLNKTEFRDCSFQEADFSEADLTESIFDNCDLERAVFRGTDLQKVDFRTSHNYSIDPEANKISGAKFSRNELQGLLERYNIIIE